ncbi:MAG: hypothetical protein AVDCRST_MAG31-1890 [uncultured Sphingomonas sp.]|uniref:Uncharacterized protein n=1 Tax=uncultured Sphingomonas sp. TaxID=158754 RepID=A0A6J4TK01_9SPHN|nr:hypothetical protein [uncultured Sphingomonas sp.]CAA9525466.1 MAG: hypothetical protein AVDCRST_MAG31-1890 [uncultured Sphingomonas sp.]
MNPSQEAVGKTPSFGNIEVDSRDYQTLCVALAYKEGKLRLQFNDVRAFMTSWDGDPNPFLTFEEASSRPSDLLKVERSRWLASEHFHLDIDSSDTSAKPWEHFYLVASERSLHVAARDDVEATWVPGAWLGKPGEWEFIPAQ